MEPPADVFQAGRVMQLPGEVLVSLLSWVPTKARLSTCALVSRAWAAAAVAATTELAAEARTLPQQLQWVRAHPAAVTSFSITGDDLLPWTPPPLLHQRLPFASLRSLQLQCVPVQLQSGRQQHAGLVDSLSALTRLEMVSCCFIMGGAGALAALGRLTNLQHLDLSGACSMHEELAMGMLEYDFLWNMPGRYLNAPGSMLQHLVHLTQLRLLGSSDDTLTHISRLTRLQHLRLEHCSSQLSARGLAGLRHLPRLAVFWFEQGGTAQAPGVTIDEASTPFLTQLTALQEVDLHVSSGFDPALLAHMPQLRHLSIWYTPLLGRGGTAALLQLLPGLQQLTCLKLDPATRPDAVAPPPAAAFSALTASSQLQFLQICPGLVLPDAMAVQHMFPAQRVLQHLTGLDLHVGLQDSSRAGRAAARDCDWLDDVALERIARACPRLQHLRLSGYQPGPSSMRPLLQCPLLRSLELLRVSCEDIGGVLARLMGLRELQAEWPGDCETSLLPLTALQHLERIYMPPARPLVAPPRGPLQCFVSYADNQAPPGEPSDVQRKMLDAAMRSEQCRPLLIAQLLEEQADRRTRQSRPAGCASITSSRLQMLSALETCLDKVGVGLASLAES